MTILHELRYAWRRLRKSSGLSLLAVLAMAFGISLTTTMIGVVDGFVFSSLPFDDAERLIHLESNRLAHGISSMGATQHDFEAWREQQTSFEGLAGFTSGKVNLSDKELAERVRGAWISASFLDLLGVAPIQGRGSARHISPSRRCSGPSWPVTRSLSGWSSP